MRSLPPLSLAKPPSLSVTAAARQPWRGAVGRGGTGPRPWRGRSAPWRGAPWPWPPDMAGRGALGHRRGGEVAPARLLPGKGAARWALGARRLHRRERLLPRRHGARAGWTPTPSRATTSSELEVAAGGCGRRFPSRHCCSSWLRYRRAMSFLMFIDL